MEKNPKSVLIVEDEEIISLGLKIELEELGINVCGRISKGDDLLNSVKNLNPDLVLLDIRLKGTMTGIDACNELHANGLYPKVIYMTAYSDKDMINAAEQTGPAGFMEKPIDPRRLSKLLSL